MSPPCEGFRFHREVAVRYDDVDAAGHVHHARAFLYFEEARAAYWREVVGRPGLDDVDYVLAEGHVRWIAPIGWPETLTVCLRVASMGRKHFRIEYLVRSGDGREVVEGHTVQVMYDYDGRRSKEIPAEVRAVIVAYEGPLDVDA